MGGGQAGPLGLYDESAGLCRGPVGLENSCEPPPLVSRSDLPPAVATRGPVGLDDEVEGPLPGLTLARGMMFVIVEQLPTMGPDANVIRKVLAIPRDFSLVPDNPSGVLTLGEHAAGKLPGLSQFLSASDRPFGGPTIQGKPLLIDMVKARAAGATIHSVEEVVADLKRLAQIDPSVRARLERLIWAVEKVEGEVLIEGSVPGEAVSIPSAPHKAYVESAEKLMEALKEGAISKSEFEAGLHRLREAYQKARVVGKVGRALGVVGMALTAYDLGKAGGESLKRGTVRPLAAETIRQAGGWGAGWLGAKVGFGVGAVFGIETGPGAIVTGAVGAIVFGAAGYLGFDMVADSVWEN